MTKLPKSEVISKSQGGSCRQRQSSIVLLQRMVRADMRREYFSREQ